LKAFSLALMLALGSITATVQPSHAHDGGPGERGHAAKYLYIWAGDQARIAPDFVTVIDFDEHSKDYGKILKVAPVPTAGNEAHHMHLSADGNTLACGGLLSLLKNGQDGIFFFDVSTPDDPQFLKSTSAPLSAITDDFYPLADGGFLVTQMGSNTGDAPGRVAEFDADLNLVKEWPETPPTDGFNPHGISVRPEVNLMVTSDFINPITTVVGFGPPVVRGSLRVWDLAQRTIVRSIFIPTALGTMDVKLIPGDKRRRAFTAGMFDSVIYLVDTQTGAYRPVFDPSTISGAPMSMPQIMAVTSDGTRLIFPLLATGQLVMLDVVNPERPFVLDVVNLGPDSQPHDIDLTEDGKRLIVTDYFVNEDGAGLIHFEGDHKVHVLRVTRRKLELDTRFNLDFNTAFPTPARPHGMASK
jgi:selenium-binding protein 1